MRDLSRRTALIGLLGTGAAVVGCTGQPTTSSSPDTSPPGSPSPTPTPTPSVDTRPRWPLSGRLLSDESKAAHAAVAVKVPDNRNEHPQRGIEKADIVFVELDGYVDESTGDSGTRLVPVFHSKMPDAVGPVRSIRPVDIALLSPMHAIIGNTGATGWVKRYAKHNGSYIEGMLSYMNTRGTGSYSIDPSRVRVLNGTTYYDRAVVCHPAVLAKQTKKFRDGPPQLYFPFGDASTASTVDGQQATRIRVPWHKADSYEMSYAWDADSKTWLRSMPWGPHVTSDGVRVAPDNVLVIRARQYYDKIFSGSGHDEPMHAIIDGSGKFHYFNGGRYVTGTWHKGDTTEPFEFALDSGAPLVMAPGQTYVELPDVDAKIVVKG